MAVKIEVRDGYYYYYPGPNGERLRKKVTLVGEHVLTEEEQKRYLSVDRSKTKVFTETHPEAKLDDEDYD